MNTWTGVVLSEERMRIENEIEKNPLEEDYKM